MFFHCTAAGAPTQGERDPGQSDAANMVEMGPLSLHWSARAWGGRGDDVINYLIPPYLNTYRCVSCGKSRTIILRVPRVSGITWGCCAVCLEPLPMIVL